MSADLLAEFDSFYSKPQQAHRLGAAAPASSAAGPQSSITSSSDPFNFSAFGSTTSHRAQGPASPPQTQQHQQQQQSWGVVQASTAATGDAWGDFSSFDQPTILSAQSPADLNPKAAVDEDDGWGDFETAEATTIAEPPKSPPRGHGRMRASTFDLLSNNLVDLNGLQPPQPQPSSQQHQRHQPSISGTSSVLAYDVKPAQPPAVRPNPQPPQRKPADPNVLFDAEDYQGGDDDDDDDDDFGDFETGDAFPAAAPAWQPKPQSTPPPPPSSLPPAAKPKHQVRVPAPLSLDLLSLDDSPAPSTSRRTGTHGPTLSVTSLSSLTSPTSLYPQAPKSPSFNDRNPFPGLALKTPTTPDFRIPEPEDKNDHSPTPVTAWPTFEGDADTKPEEWSPFEDFAPQEKKPAAKPTAAQAKKAPAQKKPEPKPADTSDSWDWDAVDVPPAQQQPAPSATAVAVSTAVLEDHGSDAAPPPTNIPPPSVLLSIFPQLLSLANTSLFKPLAGQAQSIRDRVASDPATTTFLRAYLLLATVAARIVAGRKLRWHRDRFLAQGMAISAAGAKGMKLAGVDRTQAAREDREAADLVAVWREHVGRLRSAVAAANSTSKTGVARQLRVPELAENIAVTTAKMVPTAPKPCVVCGLKRDERVARVDFDVEDSFGEWWVEHWGHRACKNFWIEHEKQLRSR